MRGARCVNRPLALRDQRQKPPRGVVRNVRRLDVARGCGDDFPLDEHCQESGPRICPGRDRKGGSQAMTDPVALCAGLRCSW